MNPGEVIALVAVLSIGAGTLITSLALILKHRQRMVGATGKGGDLRSTVQLLTEALEHQHERQQALARRLEALEAEREAYRQERDADREDRDTMPRLTVPAADLPESDAPARLVRTRTT